MDPVLDGHPAEPAEGAGGAREVDEAAVAEGGVLEQVGHPEVESLVLPDPADPGARVRPHLEEDVVWQLLAGVPEAGTVGAAGREALVERGAEAELLREEAPRVLADGDPGADRDLPLAVRVGVQVEDVQAETGAEVEEQKQGKHIGRAHPGVWNDLTM